MKTHTTFITICIILWAFDYVRAVFGENVNVGEIIILVLATIIVTILTLVTSAEYYDKYKHL